MTRGTCEYYCASDVFKDLPLAFDALSNTSRFTWGDNNRSLVTASRIYDALDDMTGPDDPEASQVEEALKRLKDLGEAYVDLEN